MTNLAHPLLRHSLMTSLQRVGKTTGAVIVNLATRWRQRREVRQLAEFDDRMLSDIGLARGEVEGALAEPFFRDRAVFLVRWDEPLTPIVPVAPASVRLRAPLAAPRECRA